MRCLGHMNMISPEDDNPNIRSMSPCSAIRLPWTGNCESVYPPWPKAPVSDCLGLRSETWYDIADQPLCDTDRYGWESWQESEISSLASSTISQELSSLVLSNGVCAHVAIANLRKCIYVLIWDTTHRLMIQSVPKDFVASLIKDFAKAVCDNPSFPWPSLEEVSSNIPQSGGVEDEDETDDDAASANDMSDKGTTSDRIRSMQFPPYNVPEDVIRRLKSMNWDKASFRIAAYDLSVPSNVLKYTAARLGIMFPNDGKELRNIQILSAYANGDTLEAIGEMYQVTRERVRQICDKWNWPSRTEMRAIAIAEKQRSVMNTIRDRWDDFIADWNDGTTTEDMASALCLEEQDLCWAIESLGLSRENVACRIRRSEARQREEQVSRLRQAIERRGRTMSEISKAIGRHPVHLSVCLAKGKVPEEKIADLCRILDIPEVWLRDGLGSPHWHQDDGKNDGDPFVSSERVIPPSAVEDVQYATSSDAIDIGYDFPGTEEIGIVNAKRLGTIEISPMPIRDEDGILVVSSTTLRIHCKGTILSATVNNIRLDTKSLQDVITVPLNGDGSACDVIIRIAEMTRPWIYAFRHGRNIPISDYQVAVVRSPSGDTPIFLGGSHIFPSGYLPHLTIIPTGSEIGYQTRRGVRLIDNELDGGRIERLTADGRALKLTIANDLAAWVRFDDGWFVDGFDVTSDVITGRVISRGKRNLLATVIDFGGPQPSCVDIAIPSHRTEIEVALPVLTNPCRCVAIHDGETILYSADRMSCQGLWVRYLDGGDIKARTSAIQHSHASANSAASLIVVCAALRHFHKMLRNAVSDYHISNWESLTHHLSRWLTNVMRSHPKVAHHAMLVMGAEQAHEAMARMPILRYAYLAINPDVELPSVFPVKSIPAWQIFAVNYNERPMTRELKFVHSADDLVKILRPMVLDINRFRHRPDLESIRCTLVALGSNEDGTLVDLPRAWLSAISQGVPSTTELDPAWGKLPLMSLAKGLRGLQVCHEWDIRCLQLAELCWSGNQSPESSRMFSTHERRSPVHSQHPMHRLWRFYVHVIGSLRCGSMA
jgi:hypothetical protein